MENISIGVVKNSTKHKKFDDSNLDKIHYDSFNYNSKKSKEKYTY